MPPEDEQSVEGSNVVFTCFAIAEPIHSVYWYFTDVTTSDTVLITSTTTSVDNNKYTLDLNTASDSYGLLNISNVTYGDRGTYSCNVSNIHGYATGSATLAVQGVTILYLHTCCYINSYFTDKHIVPPMIHSISLQFRPSSCLHHLNKMYLSTAVNP